MGIAYQLKDDLFDIYGDDKVIGKGSSDVSEFKQTILYSYTVQTPYKDELLKYYGSSKIDSISKVREIFYKSGAKEYVISTMEKLFDESASKLLQLSS